MAIPKFLKGLRANNQRITDVGDPSGATDAANKQYVDSVAAGRDWKESARVKSVGNLNLAAPGSTINGVAMAANDRVLVPHQTDAGDNGIYRWVSAVAPMVRTSDADSAGDLNAGATISVIEGTVDPMTRWTLVTPDPIVLGTTDLTFTKDADGGTAYTAGDGLDLTADEFSVVPGNGILADGTSTRVDPSIVARIFQADCVVTTNPQTFPHGLGKRPLVMILEGEDVVYPDTTVDVTEIVVDWGSAPTAAQYRVVAVG